MKITKTIYLHTFTVLTIILALVRCVYDSGVVKESVPEIVGVSDSVACPAVSDESVVVTPVTITPEKDFVAHRILSVPSFKEAFPDSNEVQLKSAMQYGVKPVQNRLDAEKRRSELVYAGVNPYFYIDPLRESIPYLVPRASVLLQDIGRAFYDSLYVKGIPLHKIIVTSVLRTEDDIVRLRRHNVNASENSCHRFGTTFDICYNRYVTVQTESCRRRQVRNDSLKWVLSEVLRDARESGRCYVKYEVKQGCFHITTR